MNFSKKIILFFTQIAFFNLVFAQNNFNNDVIVDTITVSKSKTKIEVLKQIYKLEKNANTEAKSTAEILNTKPNFYIKTYGKGQLASISYKGFGAAHTNINWNGIKLNSVMLGQSDLNVLTLGNADKIVFSNQNADNLAGNINLQTDIKYNSKNELNLSASVGSFVSSSGNISYLYSKKKFFSQSLISYQAAKNNFGYINPSLPKNTKTKQKNAQTKLLNLEQIFGFKLNARNQIKTFLKYYRADRNIAPSLFETNASENQKDNLFLAKLAWHHKYKKLETKLNSAYVYQDLQYQFSILSSKSKNFTYSWQTDFAIKYKFNKNLNLNIDAKNELETAKSNNYIDIKKRNRLSLAGDLFYKVSFFESSIGFSQMLVNNDLKIFLPKASLQFMAKNLPANLVVNGNYQAKLRIPTFNELYWNPGGNPDLIEETSHNISLTIILEKKYKKTKFKNRFEYFASWANNFIQWQPTSNIYWQPENIGKVFSRGFSNQLYVAISLHKNVALDFDLAYTFTKTNAKNSQKQLLYVPFTQANFASKLRTKWFHFFINQKYTSQRFADKNNDIALNAFYLLDIYAGHTFKFKNKDELELGAALNNITNTTYFTVINRPLPGINFEFSIKYKLNFKK
ncbi:MAG: TonB-dependent receptor plug domain-containing protein [Chitinophagales bacterium]